MEMLTFYVFINNHTQYNKHHKNTNYFESELKIRIQKSKKLHSRFRLFQCFQKYKQQMFQIRNKLS